MPERINIFCPIPGQREKINLDFYFYTRCALKGFVKTLKAHYETS